MPKIVLSYRRSDSAAITGRIFDRLQEHYGDGVIFMDIDAIPFGFDFRTHINEALSTTDILLGIVGPGWFGTGPDGVRRIDDEADFVRLEVETALNRGIPVIPVLVERATMPAASELPETLRAFAYRQSAVVDSGIDFHSHMDRLLYSMDQALAKDAHQADSALQAANREAAGSSLTAASAAASASDGAVAGEPVASSVGALRGQARTRYRLRKARANVAVVERAHAELGAYGRDEYSLYAGDYLFIRPASAARKQVYAYPFRIEWDSAKPGLVLRQVPTSHATQFGHISIPRSSIHIFVLSNDAGWLKFAVFSQLDHTKRMRGMLLTPGQTTGGVYVPTAMPVVLKKIADASEHEARTVGVEDAEYKEFCQELAQVVSERYVRILRVSPP